MSMKDYQRALTRVKHHYAEKYAKTYALLKNDAADTLKAIVMVVRYRNSLTEKIDNLAIEMSSEYNSEAWNTMIHDKRLQIDTNPMSGDGGARARGKAKAKGKAGRGRGNVGRAMQ